MHGNKGRKRSDLSNRNYTHGDKTKKLYRIWSALKTRCNNPNHCKYHRYGGRGIVYDPAWETYIEFKKQMKVKWIQAKRKYGKNCLSIERLNPNGNYCYDNCTFIPMADQAKNRVAKYLYRCLSPKGKIFFTRNLKKFAKDHNLTSPSCYKVVHGKRNHHKGWTFNWILKI